MFLHRLEHSNEVLFIPDDDIQQLSVRLQYHDNVKGIYLKASMVMVAVRGGCVCVGGGCDFIFNKTEGG